ncbi:hypothetical protein LSH36_903g00093 [Paralvinella palmiformis]|uniref:Pre-mRNA-splicing factor 18 n=1 Tax=Paralvinella palmiformis TaxID=53620 RepID=A0AAD9MRA3_9ANNE|nr:hypothetical protein LSH36_903g00093 [Paralvinella palmiformis]
MKKGILDKLECYYPLIPFRICQHHMGTSQAPNRKYFKRGDLAAKQAEEYWKKHKRFKLDEESENADVRQPEGDLKSVSAGKEGAMLPRKEVIRRFRERNEPIRLFAETDYEAFQRLKNVEMLIPEINKGLKNDFKAAMDEVDQQYLNELVQSSGQSDEAVAKAADVKTRDDGTTIEDIQKLAEGLGKGDKPLDQDVCLKFLKLVLNKWGEDLNKRNIEHKRSFQGKLASATHTQTVTYIKPLFKKLKRKELEPEILECLVDIIKRLLDRHYLKANDAYLEMAIGNAPWPIGVTMVGIHARTGREKISARNVAHVLNDETQRKYIQAIKRLMTQCQKFFPTVPSRCVDYDRSTSVN